MDEERLLAKKNNQESPICETFNLTTENYHNNLHNIISNLTPNSEVNKYEFSVRYNFFNRF